jgi:hypothetical protein
MKRKGETAREEQRLCLAAFSMRILLNVITKNDEMDNDGIYDFRSTITIYISKNENEKSNMAFL